MTSTRRGFLQTLGSASAAVTLANSALVARHQSGASERSRRFSFVQVDVFTSRRLQGNPLSVFTDARGLTKVIQRVHRVRVLFAYKLHRKRKSHLWFTPVALPFYKGLAVLGKSSAACKAL
jgi:hypothetical protein